MIKLTGITKKYPTRNGFFHALRNISTEIRRGEFVSVTGHSGAGKSTLLFVVGGMIRPEQGKVMLEGVDYYRLPEKEKNSYRKRNIGFVFQQFHLIPYLSVYDNIRMACQNGEAVKSIPSLLQDFLLADKSAQLPHQLSVGEKQRTAFIRAVVSDPDIILADEPTGNLDEENSRMILKYLENYNRKGKTVLLVTHDRSVAGVAGRIIHLDHGEIQ